MKRKFLLLTVITLILAIGLAACAKPHEHIYSKDWSSDDTYHWHRPLCDDTEPTKEKHTFNGDKCIVCGYEREPSVKPGDGEGDTPGEGETPGEQTPGEGETPGGEQPGEGETPGGEQPGGELPGGDIDDSEYEEPDTNVDITKLPDETEKPDHYYTNIDDVFKNVTFQNMIDDATEGDAKDEEDENSDGGAIAAIDDDGSADGSDKETEQESEVDKAWARVTQTLRNVELGKGFAFGDVVIDERRIQAFSSAIGTWQFKGLNGSIKNATKLNIKEKLDSKQMEQVIDNATYYANMHGAYEISGGLARSFKIEKAAAYVAQDIFDSFRYHLAEFQFCIGSTEGITKQYARSNDYYYIQAVRKVVDSSMGIDLPIITTIRAAYYKDYLVAFRHTMKYEITGVDMYSDAYILVTEVKESIARPQQTYMATSGAPAWVPVPHKNLDPTKDFTDTGMKQVTDFNEAYEAYNTFANSVAMAGYGFDYIAPRGDVQLKTKNSYSETEITFDKYSEDGYLIHKTTKGMDFESDDEKDTVDCEQYLDSKYVYQHIKRVKGAADDKTTKEGTETEEKKKYLNEGYSDFYSYVLTYDITENIMTLLSGYCEAVNENLDYYGYGDSYLPKKHYTLYKKVSGEYTIYLIKFSNKKEESKTDEANSTEFTAYYAFDSAGALCGAHIELINTSEKIGDAIRKDVTTLEFLVGDYKVKIPEEFTKFEAIEQKEGEELEPYLDF